MNWHEMKPYVTLDLPAKWPWEEAMKRIRVPEGMLKAAQEAALKVHRSSNGHGFLEEFIVISLEAALLWLSEHPQVPTDEQLTKMVRERGLTPNGAYDWRGAQREWLVEWQRRCFVQEDPEPTLDEVVEALISHLTIGGCDLQVAANKLEAYRRGLRKGEQK